jgi:hypothetical protein
VNHSHELMSREQVRRYLAEAEALGVQDYYFTGGEPFLHRELPGILEDTLRIGPATVLTNATLLTTERADALAALAAGGRHPLEIRVSLDGLSPETNDPIRGEGSFEAAVRGLRELARVGFNPILTITRAWSDEEDERMRAEYHGLLRGNGFPRPRVKVLDLFRLGEEARRSRGYTGCELLTAADLEGFDPLRLQCTTSRMVTSRGVYVCPILIDAPDARLGDTLRESMRPYALAHGACHTCRATGVTCRN